LNLADAYGSSLFYVVVYVLTTLASFGTILLMTRNGFEAETLDDFKGLAARSPWFAWMMLIVMFSLAGIPPTVGFYAKLSVLEVAMNAGKIWLAVVAVMFSLIGAFYYLRVVKVMFFDEPRDSTPIAEGRGMRLLLSINGLSLLVLGLMPGGLMALCLTTMKGSL
jgi:NADH-quinone oxidoreductase subunit N